MRTPIGARRPPGEPRQVRRAATIAEQPFGKGLLVLLAVGPRRLRALWRLAQAILDRDDEGEDPAGRAKRATALGEAGWYAVLCGLTVSVLVGGDGGNGNQQQTTAGVFERPLGRYVVYAAGLAFLGAAGVQRLPRRHVQVQEEAEDAARWSETEEQAATGVGILGHLARLRRLRPDRPLPRSRRRGSSTQGGARRSTAPCSSSPSSRTAGCCSAPSPSGCSPTPPTASSGALPPDLDARRSLFAGYSHDRWRRSPTAARFRSTGTPIRPCCGSSGSGSSGARGSTPAGRTRSRSRARSSPATRAASRSSSSADREGDAARVPERLPPSRLARLRGRGAARDAAVPLPRLDVRPRRLAPRGAAHRRRAGLRPERARPRPRVRGHLGAVRLRQPGRGAPHRSRSISASSRRWSPPPASTSTTLRFLERSTSEVEANWKVCCENYLECYHCQVAHPGFSKVVDVSVDAYLLEQSPTFSTQYGPVREAWRGEFDPRGPVARGQFHFLWPNVTINIMPGQPNLSIGPVVPAGPERTSRFLDYFVGARRRRGLDPGPARVRRPGRRRGHRARGARAERACGAAGSSTGACCRSRSA